MSLVPTLAPHSPTQPPHSPTQPLHSPTQPPSPARKPRRGSQSHGEPSPSRRLQGSRRSCPSYGAPSARSHAASGAAPLLLSPPLPSPHPPLLPAHVSTLQKPFSLPSRVVSFPLTCISLSSSPSPTGPLYPTPILPILFPSSHAANPHPTPILFPSSHAAHSCPGTETSHTTMVRVRVRVRVS